VRRVVHLITGNAPVAEAIRTGLATKDVLIEYPRVGSASVKSLRGATHLVLDLGVADGHGVGYHFLRRALFAYPELRVYVLTNAPVPEILPRDLRPDQVQMTGKGKLARR
jgi:hypothetical protein